MKKSLATALVFLLLFTSCSKTFSFEPNALMKLKFSFLNRVDNTKKVDIEEKSPSKALLFSLILPGLGEKYVGNNKLSKYLIIGEIALWGSYIYYNVYSNWIEDDYKLFSTSHAGVNIGEKDKKYFVNIGNFYDIYGYNNKKRLDRDDEFVYDDINSYYWRWDSEENRKKFKDMRIKSDKFNNRLNYFVAGIFLNHIISGINAALSANKFNKSIKTLSKLNLEYKMCNTCTPEDFRLTLKYRF